MLGQQRSEVPCVNFAIETSLVAVGLAVNGDLPCDKAVLSDQQLVKYLCMMNKPSYSDVYERFDVPLDQYVRCLSGCDMWLLDHLIHKYNDVPPEISVLVPSPSLQCGAVADDVPPVIDQTKVLERV
jgi:hypothetical protein